MNAVEILTRDHREVDALIAELEEAGNEESTSFSHRETFKQLVSALSVHTKAEEDIFRTYDLGVNSFITKPVSFTALAEVMKTIAKYWFEIVELPPDTNRNCR